MKLRVCYHDRFYFLISNSDKYSGFQVFVCSLILIYSFIAILYYDNDIVCMEGEGRYKHR